MYSIASWSTDAVSVCNKGLRLSYIRRDHRKGRKTPRTMTALPFRKVKPAAAVRSLCLLASPSSPASIVGSLTKDSGSSEEVLDDTLNVGNGDCFSILGFLPAGSLPPFFSKVGKETPTPEFAYTQAKLATSSEKKTCEGR